METLEYSHVSLVPAGGGSVADCSIYGAEKGIVESISQSLVRLIGVIPQDTSYVSLNELMKDDGGSH